MAQAGFWDRQEQAQAKVAEMKGLTSIVRPMDDLLKSGDDIGALVEMAEEDDSLSADLRSELEQVEANVAQQELKAMLSGPHDRGPALLTINARDGGTDANDWAEMLLRMYINWAESREYQIEVLDRQDNLEAGINSATLAVRGPFAYGYLKGETGMHRLVRISPFNAEGKRQTSFAAVDVSPEVSDEFVIDIKDEDIREDVFRASGAGGQHVNKTSSAIRLTHMPTGIVVQCQNERSQHKNRAAAYKMLRARMARIEEERREAEQLAKYKTLARVGFGSQIRSYFQHPDQRIKDERTEYKETNFQYVLDGHIQGFLDALLKWRLEEMKAAERN